MDPFDFNSPDPLFDFGAGLPANEPSPQPPLNPTAYHSNMHSPSPTSWPPHANVEAADHESSMASHQPQHHHQNNHHHLHHHHSGHHAVHPTFVAAAADSSQHHDQAQQHQHQQAGHGASDVSNQPIRLLASGLEYPGMMQPDWHFHLQHMAEHQRRHQHHLGLSDLDAFNPDPFARPLHTAPVDFIATTNAAETFPVSAAMDTATFITMAGPMESMNALVYPLDDYQNDGPLPMGLNPAMNRPSSEDPPPGHVTGSPTGTAVEVQSLSDNEGSWSLVNFPPHHHRQSFDSYSSGTVSNPSQNLHIRTHSVSSSDGPNSADLSGSFEELPPWPLHEHEYLDAQFLHAAHGLQIPVQLRPVPPSSSAQTGRAGPVDPLSGSSGPSSSTSPTSSGPLSPPSRRRKAPTEKTTKPTIKKNSSPGRKDSSAEKKVGRRRGPLRPDQRQQAHEIRKLRACLRCKFLKKTCDKGDPCGGCRPSHARLWQVPCTRMDIKDLAYFMKDWKADFERHVSLGFSVGNIKGFSALERTIYITHGYGHFLPISARDVYVRDDKCFDMDWVETTWINEMDSFGGETSKMSAGIEGISTARLSEYLDLHLDNNFEVFVQEFFGGTKFVTEMLQTTYRYYQREKNPIFRKALKLILAYNLTLHITMAEGLGEEEQVKGRIDDPRSHFHGKTLAPVMINFQVKCALADMWRELHKDVLDELSALYSSVYTGEKMKNWPAIIMLATILLTVWEEMQFDTHYRVQDEKYIAKFCASMETTPVGVITGLFQAMATKVPGLQEWDTQKHHHLLASQPAAWDALSEVRDHINQYESYLRERQNTKFDRDDFDCLSNKFLSKLVIRAN